MAPGLGSSVTADTRSRSQRSARSHGPTASPATGSGVTTPGSSCPPGWASAPPGTCGSLRPASTSLNAPSWCSGPPEHGGRSSSPSWPVSPASRLSTPWLATSSSVEGADFILAVLVAAGPVCVTYSTRIKEYPVDFLTTCLLIALQPRGPPKTHATSSRVLSRFRRRLSRLGLSRTRNRRSLAGSGYLLASLRRAGCRAASYWRRRPPPPVAPRWRPSSTPTCHPRRHGFGTSKASSSSTRRSTSSSSPSTPPAWNLLLGLFGFVQFDSAGRLLVVVGWVALSAVGVYRNPPMYGPALIVVGGFAASAAHT